MTLFLALAIACAGAAEPEPAGDDITLQGARLDTPDGVVALAPAARVSPGGDVSAQAAELTAPVEGAAPLEISADETRWDLAGGTMALRGQVQATRGAVTLTCHEADITLGPARRVERVEVRGDVVVTQGARVARAQQAVLDAATGRVTLTGEASLRDGTNAMAGEPLVVFLDDDRVECATCRLTVDASSIGQGR